MHQGYTYNAVEELSEVRAYSPYNFYWDTKERTAEEWEYIAQGFERYARGSHRAEAESFKNCDTDGALSQWAHTQTARMAHTCARLARKLGMAEYPALFDASGELVPAFVINTEFGPAWRVQGSWTDRATTRWVNVSRAESEKTQQRFYASHGYTEGTVRARSRIDSAGHGYHVNPVAIPCDKDNPHGYETIELDRHTRERNTAAVTWTGSDRAEVKLWGFHISLAHRPQPGDGCAVVSGRILRDGKKWLALDADGEPVEDGPGGTWKVALNKLVRASGCQPQCFETEQIRL